MLFNTQSEDASHGILGEPNNYDQEANKPTDKVRACYANSFPLALSLPQTKEKKEGLFLGSVLLITTTYISLPLRADVNFVSYPHGF